MKTTHLLCLLVFAVVFAASCGAPASNAPANANAAGSNANANANAAKPIAVAPTKDALMAMEKAAWEAWKNRDAKWTEANASDKYVGFGSTGRMDKAASIKSYADQKCEIKSYTLADDQMQVVGPDVAILTFRGAQDYTCDGKKGAADVHAASMYVREGDKWKAVFYGETPVVDPKAPPKPPAKKDEAKADETKPDAATEALLAVERKTWEAWKNKDGKALEEVFAKDFSFVSGPGRTDRAATIKAWSTDNKCDVKSYWLSGAKSVSLTPTVSLMTYKGGGDGTCEGAPIMTEWYGGVYIKDGETWRSAFGMGIALQ